MSVIAFGVHHRTKLEKTSQVLRHVFDSALVSPCMRQETMIECSELAGKVIRDCTIYEEGANGAEVVIEFTDETTFSVCLKASTSVDAKAIRDEGGEPQILKSFTNAPQRP